MKKYTLLKNDTKTFNGITLYRVKYLINLPGISKGDLGGYIEKESNLDHNGNAQVSGDAWVYGNAQVSGDAKVYGNAWVYGDAWVFGNAWVSGDARVSGDVKIAGRVSVITNLFEFNFTISVKDKVLIVGCKNHSFKEWEEYINENSQEYVTDCQDQDSHDNTLSMIQKIIRGEL